MPPCIVNIRPLTCADEVTVCSGHAGAVVTRVNASTSSVNLLIANATRKTVIFWNDSTSTASVKFGAGASPTDFTWKIGPQSGYELPMPVFVGIISAVWDAVSGAMQITEES